MSDFKILEAENVPDYFNSKDEIELERKVLIINKQNLEARLKNANAIRVFQGTITSYYYYGDPQQLYAPVVNVLGQGLLVVISIGNVERLDWVRLRTMEDDRGFRMDFIQTKEPIDNLIGSKRELGDPVTPENIGKLKNIYKNPKIELKPVEIKKRSVYALPNEKTFKKGIEYSIDKIIKPYDVPTFLEIEVNRFELLIPSCEIIGINIRDLTKVSTKTILNEYLKNPNITPEELTNKYGQI